MLVPGRILPALGAPLPRLIRFFLRMAKQHPAGRARNDLIPIKADDAVIPKGSRLVHPPVRQSACSPAFCGRHTVSTAPCCISPKTVPGNVPAGRPQGFRRILDQKRPMGITDLPDLPDPPRRPVKMGHHHQLHIRIDPKGPLQSLRRHVPGLLLRIDKDRFSPLIHHRIYRGIKGHIRTEHPPAIEAPASAQPIRRGNTGAAAIKFPGRQFYRQMQGCRTTAQSYGMHAPHMVLCQPLQLIDVLPNRTHPVGIIGRFHIFELFPMHCGGRKPYFIFKGYYFLTVLKQLFTFLF